MMTARARRLKAKSNDRPDGREFACCSGHVDHVLPCIQAISGNNPSRNMTFFCAHSQAATARLIFGGVLCQRVSRVTVGLGGEALPG